MISCPRSKLNVVEVLVPLHRSAVLLVFAVFLAAPAAAQTFVFHFGGDQEVPPVPSPASGGCMGVLNQPGFELSLTCVHNVVGATLMHIHQGAPGVNGPVVFDLGDPTTSPVTATWTGMTPGNIADLLAGDLYINIHTAGRPAGEIRGQILTRTVDLVPFTADGPQVVPPNDSTSTATCTADLDGPATFLAVQCTHNVAAPSAAHVHEGPFGTNGLAVFTFPSPASPLNANVPMTPQLVADFAATFLYLDIHTAGGTEEDPADEIRGQIGEPPAGAGTGTIIIRKQTFPAGGTNFGFTETITPGNFNLDDAGTETFTAVTPGTYTVTEDDPTTTPGGYTLADITCDDANSDEDPSSRSATIRVEAGEVVTCTFRNLQTDPTDDIFVFHLSGDQEVPPVATTERGGCMGRFDSGASELSLVCTHDVDLPTLMHIHRGAPGVNGPAVFDMGEPTSPVVATWSGMTPADVADLFAGNLYLNTHTSGRPAGAIRGQILVRTVDTVAFTADAGQVVPPGASAATANCTADLDNPAEQLAIDCTHNFPSPDQAHVHRAPREANGPLVHTFASAASPIGENVPMTPRHVADFAAGFLYFDIHGVAGSEETPEEQIRGQIADPPPAITTGTIRIVKTTSPAGGTGFNFTDDVPGSPGTFTLDDGQTQLFNDVTAGTYTITESVAAGYSLTDVSCSDTDSTGNPFARTATVALQPGAVVTCTFTNLQNVASPTLFVFHLSGDQEVPPTDSPALGGCFGQLNTGASSFSIVCTHNVIGPALVHIHRGAAGANGLVVFDLGDPNSPIEATWTGMTPGEIADLLAGNFYVNVHAGGRPDGEIRGQILPRTVDQFAFPLAGDQEVPPTDSTATGNCLADLADNAQSLFVGCTHDVSAISDTHLHDAPPGEDGPIVFDFPNTNTFQANVPLSPRLVADFAAGFLYVNVHAVDSPLGEIRGQLIAGAPAALIDAPTLTEWAALLMVLSLLALALVRMR